MAPLLRGAGHEVWAPTLTGLADRAHLLTPEIDLETHVRDVVELLAYEEPRGVVLVGRSYGGMVVAGAAERAAERIARLVFLDAFVPEDGQSGFALLPRAGGAMYRARAEGEGWRVPPPVEALGVTDPAEAGWLAAKLTPQPLRSMEQPVRLGDAAAAALPRTYVHCTRGAVVASFAPFAARFRSAPGWGYHELATGHDAMLTEPEALTALLLRAAG